MAEDENRTLLVTGATGGTGPFVVRRLLARGDRLVITGRDRERLEALERDMNGDGRVLAVPAQVAHPDEAAAAVAQGRERFGHVDGVVNLAGKFQAGTPVFIADPAVYQELYEANVLTAAVASQAVLRQLQGPGWFVYLTSLLAREPMPSMGPYAASKAALNAWARAFSREVRGRGAHVNVIVASLIDTPKNREEQPGLDYSQWVNPEDLAEVIAFLTSPACAAMHGSEVEALGQFALFPPPGAVQMGPPPGVGGPPPGVGGGPPPGVFAGGGPPPGMFAGGGPPPGVFAGGGPPPGVMGGPPPGVFGAGGPPNPPRSQTKRYALLYPFKPGTAKGAEELFQAGGDPPPQGGTTRLLTTTVFRYGDTVVRTFEIDGDLDEAIEHMVKAAELSDLGSKLKPFLEEHVDLTTSEGLRGFFHTQLMEIVTDRSGPPPGVGGPPPGVAGGPPPGVDGPPPGTA